MIPRIKISTLLLIIPSLSAFPQKLKKADKAVLANLETHIHYLTDERLEGCRIGTPGEKLGSDYISSEFMKAGLAPKGDNNGWLQTFTIDEGRQISPDTYFGAGSRDLVLNKDYFPLAFSATGAVSGSPAIALQEGGEPWFIDLKDILEGNQDNAHFDLQEQIRLKVKESAKKGATAVILYNSSKIPDNLAFIPKDQSEKSPVPVIYITQDAKKKYLKDESASVDIKLKVGFTHKQRTGHNVVGYIDNRAARTVIVGAHYDRFGSDRSAGSSSAADDNASGVAAAIELARMLGISKLTGNNYLFIAFSGEEASLSGSKFYVEHPSVDLSNINYMINMDMIGALNDSSHLLQIGGYGSSPVWGDACRSVNEVKFFSLHIDSSGIGPSDHTSFYQKGIPVLYFFIGGAATGTDKFNYAGELRVLKYVYAVVENVNNKGRIPFSKTHDDPSKRGMVSGQFYSPSLNNAYEAKVDH